MMCTVTCSACLAAGKFVVRGVRAMPSGASLGQHGIGLLFNTGRP